MTKNLVSVLDFIWSNNLQNLIILESSSGASTSSRTQIGLGLAKKTAKIKEIAALGVGILMIEQNAEEALRQSDRGYVLAGGKIAFHDTAQAILANPEVGQLFLGIQKEK